MSIAQWKQYIPPHVTHIISTLEANSFPTWVVGGAIRDLLIGRKPKDFDLVTKAKPEDIQKLFPKTIDIGAKFAVMIILDANNQKVEVASFRKDGQYINKRHPEEIQYAEPEDDAKRRDFSMNGIFWNTKTDTLIDYVNGQSDIKQRIIKSIGKATERFQEDALRMLRAIRFTTQLHEYQFILDTDLKSAIKSNANLIKKVSKERITQEIELILLSSNPSLGFKLLEECELDIFPYFQLSYRKKFYELLDSSPQILALRWAIVDHFISLQNRFQFTKQDRNSIKDINNLQQIIHNYSTLDTAQKKCLLVEANCELALQFYALINPNCANPQNARKDKEKWQESNKLNPKELISGKELKEYGVPTGPKYKEILGKVRKKQLLEEINSSEEAHKFLKTLL